MLSQKLQKICILVLFLGYSLVSFAEHETVGLVQAAGKKREVILEPEYPSVITQLQNAANAIAGMGQFRSKIELIAIGQNEVLPAVIEAQKEIKRLTKELEKFKGCQKGF